MSQAMSSDPYYEHGAAKWVMHRVEANEQVPIRVEVVDDLTVPGYGSRSARTIWVRAGMSFPTYHWFMARALVHQLFGIEPSPAFHPAVADRHLVAGDARIIPFQRGPAHRPIVR